MLGNEPSRAEKQVIKSLRENFPVSERAIEFSDQARIKRMNTDCGIDFNALTKSEFLSFASLHAQDPITNSYVHGANPSCSYLFELFSDVGLSEAETISLGQRIVEGFLKGITTMITDDHFENWPIFSDGSLNGTFYVLNKIKENPDLESWKTRLSEQAQDMVSKLHRRHREVLDLPHPDYNDIARRSDAYHSVEKLYLQINPGPSLWAAKGLDLPE